MIPLGACARLVLVSIVTLSAASNARALDCPAGFLSVSSVGRSLGCIQTDTPSPATAAWEDAAIACFENHAGRLPAIQEHLFARTLAGYSTPSEELWTSERTGGTAAPTTLVIQPDGTLENKNATAERNYRCFIPAGVFQQTVAVPGWIGAALAGGIAFAARSILVRRRRSDSAATRSRAELVAALAGRG